MSDKSIIDLALDMDDKEWFNELTSKYIIEQDKKTNNKVKYTQITVSEEILNNSYAIQTKNGIRNVQSLEDTEQYNLIQVKSKRVDAIKILPYEEVEIKELSIEEKYVYKLSYYQYNKGFDDCKNMYYQYFEENFKLKTQIDNLLVTNKTLSDTNKILLEINQNKQQQSKDNNIKKLLNSFKKLFKI